MSVSLTRRTFVRWLAVIYAAGWSPQLHAEEEMSNAPVPPIPVEQVDSTSIESIGYDAWLKALEVRFRSRAIYRYSTVPASVFAEFKKAESKGRFFSQRIRGRYAFVRLKDAKP